TSSAPTYLHTLSLHDALPIFPAVDQPGNLHRSSEREPVLIPLERRALGGHARKGVGKGVERVVAEELEERAAIGIAAALGRHVRSEEHTSELQSHLNLVCRLL